MLMRKLVLCALLVICSAAAFAARKQPVITRTEALGAELKDWTTTVAEGKTFELKWVYGTLNTIDSPDDKVHVTMELVAGTPAPAFQLIEHDEGITVCAIYAPAPGKQANQCQPGDRGTLFKGVGRKAAETNFTVALPATVKFAARAANGDAKSTFSGDALFDIMTSNMAIVAGRNVQARNVSGTIRAGLRPAEYRRNFTLYAMNDTAEMILVNVPVRVKAKGVPSKMFSDVPLKTSLEYGDKVEAAGQNLSGDGAVVEVELHSINGEMILRRR